VSGHAAAEGLQRAREPAEAASATAEAAAEAAGGPQRGAGLDGLLERATASARRTAEPAPEATARPRSARWTRGRQFHAVLLQAAAVRAESRGRRARRRGAPSAATAARDQDRCDSHCHARPASSPVPAPGRIRQDLAPHCTLTSTPKSRPAGALHHRKSVPPVNDRRLRAGCGLAGSHAAGRGDDVPPPAITGSPVTCRVMTT
jgi:hypothetical protein